MTRSPSLSRPARVLDAQTGPASDSGPVRLVESRSRSLSVGPGLRLGACQCRLGLNGSDSEPRCLGLVHASEHDSELETQTITFKDMLTLKFCCAPGA